jgi:hypothetical protein
LQAAREGSRKIRSAWRAHFCAPAARSKASAGDFLSFAQKKFGFSKEVLEEAYKVMIDALSNEGIIEDGVLQAVIDEAKAVANVTKPVSHLEVADYSFLRGAIKR